MKSIWKKTISFVLTACMLLGMLPVQAQAAVAGDTMYATTAEELEEGFSNIGIRRIVWSGTEPIVADERITVNKETYDRGKVTLELKTDLNIQYSGEAWVYLAFNSIDLSIVSATTNGQRPMLSLKDNADSTCEYGTSFLFTRQSQSVTLQSVYVDADTINGDGIYAFTANDNIDLTLNGNAFFKPKDTTVQADSLSLRLGAGSVCNCTDLKYFYKDCAIEIDYQDGAIILLSNTNSMECVRSCIISDGEVILVPTEKSYQYQIMTTESIRQGALGTQSNPYVLSGTVLSARDADIINKDYERAFYAQIPKLADGEAFSLDGRHITSPNLVLDLNGQTVQTDNSSEDKIPDFPRFAGEDGFFGGRENFDNMIDHVGRGTWDRAKKDSNFMNHMHDYSINSAAKDCKWYYFQQYCKWEVHVGDNEGALRAVEIEDGAKLTIMDSSSAQTGCVKTDAIPWYESYDEKNEEESQMNWQGQVIGAVLTLGILNIVDAAGGLGDDVHKLYVQHPENEMFHIAQGGELIVDGGTFEFVPKKSGYSEKNETKPTMFMVDGGKLTINGGEFMANGIEDHTQVFPRVIEMPITDKTLEAGTSLTINGGTFWNENRGHAVLLHTDVENATIINWMQYPSTAPVQIREGTFRGASGAIAHYSQYEPGIYEPDLGYTVNKGEYTDSYKVNLVSGGNVAINLMSGSTATGNTTQTVITSTEPYVPEAKAEDAEIHSFTFSANGTTGTEITYADFEENGGITATVDATSPDGGKLLYSWYVNGQCIKITESNTLLIEDDVDENIFWYTNYRGDRVRNFFDDGMLLSALSVECCVSNYHDDVVSDTVISDVCNLIRTTKPLPDRSKITLTALDDDSVRLDGLDDDYIFTEPSYRCLFEGETSEEVYGLKDGDGITLFNQAQAWEKYTVDSEPITIYVGQENPPEVITRGTPGENQVIAEPTTTGSDGRLQGVTSDMEWRKKGETDWRTGNNYGYAIDSLVVGTYEVRNKGTDKLYSEPAEVEVGMMMGAAAVELEIQFEEPDGSEDTLYLLNNETATWLDYDNRPAGVGWANAPTFDASTGTLDLNDMTIGNKNNPVQMTLSGKVKTLLIDQDTEVYGRIYGCSPLTITGDKTLTINHGYEGFNGDGLYVNSDLVIDDTKVVIKGLEGEAYSLTGISAYNSITLKGKTNVTITEPPADQKESVGIECAALYLLEESVLSSTVGTATAPVQTGSYALKTDEVFMVGSGPYEFRAWVYEAGKIVPYCARTADETIEIRQACTYREKTDSGSFKDVTTNQPYGSQYNGFMRMGSTKNATFIEITLHEGEVGNSIAEIPEGSVVNPEKTGNKPFHVTADVFGDIGISQGVIWSWESDDVPEDDLTYLFYDLHLGTDGSLLLWTLHANKTYTIVATSIEDPDVQGRFTFTVGDVMEKLEGKVTMTLDGGKTEPREGDVITIDTSGVTNGTGQYTYHWRYNNVKLDKTVWFETPTPQLTITSDMVGTGVNLYGFISDRGRSGTASSTNKYYNIGSYVKGDPQVTGVDVSPSRVNVNPGGSVYLSAWQLGLDLSDIPEFSWEVEFNKNGTYVELTPVDDTKGCTVAIKDNAPIGTEIRVKVESEGEAVVSTLVVVDKETNNLIGVRQDDITYGEKINPQAIYADGATQPNGGTITYRYKPSTASYADPFVSTEPTAQGTYLVRAISNAVGNVDGASVQSSFTIYGKEPNESAIVKYLNLKAGTDGVQSVDLTQYIPSDADNVAIKTTAYGPTEDNPEIASMFADSNELRTENSNATTFALDGEEVGDVGTVITTITSDNYATIFVLIEVTIVDKQPQNLSFTTSQYNKTAANKGDSFTNTLTGAKTAVTYTVSGDTGALTIDNSGKVTLTGVAGVVAITATAAENTTYAKATAAYIVQVTSEGDLYQVTVEGGTGSGQYAPGETVTITATPPSGNTLDKWTVESGEITLKDETATTTTFTMPDSAVVVKATVKEGNAGLLGDVNGDGSVDGVDAVSILNFAAGRITLDANAKILADVNKDGAVDGTDAITVLNFSVGKISSFN